jgi:hypothetical protein
MQLYPLISPSHGTEFILPGVKWLITCLYPVTRLKIRRSLRPLLTHFHDIFHMHRHSSTTSLAIVHSTVNCVLHSFCMKIRICLIHCIFKCQSLYKLLFLLPIFEKCMFLKIELSLSVSFIHMATKRLSVLQINPVKVQLIL